MNRTRLLDVFAPKYNSLFPAIEKNAENLVLAAEQLEILLRTDDLQKPEDIIVKLNELQNISDSLTNDTYSILRSLFIIPFDKEDINELVNQINDFMESINKIGRMLYSGKVLEQYPIYKDLAGIITQASNELYVCCRYFRNTANNKREINACCENLSNYEKRANEILYSGILDHLVDNENSCLLTRKKKTLELFMTCIHQAVTITKVIKRVIIKVM
jgi:uncharacterized protein Yka (UPF0111/DUF47 family)